MVDRDLAEGRLIELLPELNQIEPQQIHAVYTERAERSARLKVFLAFLESEFSNADWNVAHQP